MLGERLWLGGKVKNKLSIRNSTKTEKIKGDQSTIGDCLLRAASLKCQE
jgi:hypothetical protein